MRRIGMALAVIAAVALHCAAQSAGARSGINFYSLNNEIALGRELASELQQQLRVVRDLEINAYVDRVGQALAAAPAAAPFTYSFVVVRDAVPNAAMQQRGLIFPWRSGPEEPLEPLAVPGGGVLVPVQAFEAAENEAQLAGLLAHAMVHITHRHGTRMATRTQMVKLGAERLPASASSETVKAAMPLALLSFARLFERKADHESAALMVQAGYDPAELVRVLERSIPERRAGSGAVFATHPPKQGRIEAIRAVILTPPPRPYKPPDEEFQRIRAMVAQLPPD